jgi:hypothetical protein
MNEYVKTGVEVATLLLALWWHATSSKRRQEAMHQENSSAIREMKVKVDLLYEWMRRQVFGIGKRD